MPSAEKRSSGESSAPFLLSGGEGTREKIDGYDACLIKPGKNLHAEKTSREKRENLKKGEEGQ